MGNSSDQVNNGNNIKIFEVDGSNFTFSPKSITVKKGDKVKINFVNKDGFHDFRIDEFKVATNKINGGSSESVEFTADRSGSFEYYCSVGNHRAMGMSGKLIVE
jgi:plastocyanin